MIPVHNPESIRYAYIGPVVGSVSTGRITRKFSDNKGPAFVPDSLIHEALRWNSSIPIEHVMLRPVITTQLWLDLQEAIEDQFETRIALFFRQALFLYLTKFTLFHFYAADAQVGMPGKGMGEASGKYDCAHMATLGALRIINHDNKIVALGQNSSLHLADNITAWLPKEVNQVDCLLDFQSEIEGRTFRNTVTCILQSASTGLLTPLFGVGWFIRYAYLHLEKSWNGDLSNEKRYVIQRYVEVIRCYDIMVREDPQALLRKLCYLSEDDERSEFAIYRDVQGCMHRIFEAEMNVLKHTPVALLNETAQTLNPFFKEALAYYSFNYPIKVSKTADNYASMASCSENVQNAVRNVLAKMGSADEFYSILNELRELRYLYALQQVERAVREIIPVKNPQKMPHILYWTLEKIVYALS